MRSIPKRFLPHTVIVRLFMGTGPYGTTYGDPVAYRCRVAGEYTLVRDSKGTEVVSSGRVTTTPDCQATAGSKIKLPGETAEREVISSSAKTGIQDTHHIELNYT